MTEQLSDETYDFPEKPFVAMSQEELAMDWIKRVAAVPTLVLDSYVVTEEGMQLTREAREAYQGQFDDLPAPTQEENERRNQEWQAISQAIVDADPAVVEKNQFMAMLVEPDHPRIPSRTIKLLAELRKAAEHEPDSMTYIDQFLGLWAVYKAGQASEE